MDQDVLNCKLAPAAAAMDCVVGAETVILNAETGTYYGLDPVGSAIWTLLKDGVAIPAICQQVAADFGAPVDLVQSDARAFLQDLIQHQIITVN